MRSLPGLLLLYGLCIYSLPFYGRCLEGIGHHIVKMSLFLYVCLVTFSRPLIGQKRECYIVEEVIEVDELDKGNISVVLGKQDK